MDQFRLTGFAVFLCLTAWQAVAQVPRQVEWDAEYMEYDKSVADGAYRLIHNVVFRHQGALMYCDSAYFYKETNSLDAFENVHINQGDTVDIYGDFLHYNGNTKVAEIRRNVRLEGKNTTLRTQWLDFDLGSNIGYYTRYADIESGEDRLSSVKGYYYSDAQMYFFRDSVVLKNPEYTIYSDTLKYDAPDRTAYFFGPTEIIGDSSYIYCESGWYNTQSNISTLRKKALVQNKTQTIKADTLYYERETGYGEGFSNIEVRDDEQNVILYGNRAIIHQDEDRAMMTDSAMFVYITEDDSVFVHADTLRAMPDTSGNRQLSAYYGVRLYKSDLQGACDSLFYSTSDSILRLFDTPVLWSGENQLSADYMEIWTRNRQIDQMHLKQLALIVNREDTSRYNQIKGKSMVCYFADNQLSRIIARGNGQSVYYAKDNDKLIGVNVAESSDLVIEFNGNEVDNILFLVKPKAVLYPLAIAPRDALILKDFKWEEEKRPRSRYDIFRK